MVVVVVLVEVVAIVDVVGSASAVHAAGSNAQASNRPTPRICPTLLTMPPVEPLPAPSHGRQRCITILHVARRRTA